jgi:integrase
MHLRAYSDPTMVNQYTPKVSHFATQGSTYVARQKPSRKLTFTKKALDKLPFPTNGQRSYFYDSSTRGLALAISPAGKKVFILYRKIAGRPERVTIGAYPDLTIDQARGEAARLNGAIARGENPASKRRVVRDEATLGELFATWLEHHAKPNKKTWADDEGMFANHLNAWKVRKISDIRRMDIVSLHAHIGSKSGPYSANRIVELLSSMFNKGIEWGWDGQNPATKVKAFREKKRERFLQPEELPAFFEALSKELNQTIRDYILVALLTGARRANVQAMRWEEINWQSATWRIPETKNGEPVTLPLSPQATAILESRKADSESKWVFPGVGTTGHLVEPKAAWKRILKDATAIQIRNWVKANPGKDETHFAKEFPGAGFRDLRLHDLRRTLGSWQAATGASLPIIGKSLGHKSLGATQVYARLNLDPVRASVNKATDALLLAANVAAKLLENGNG